MCQGALLSWPDIKIIILAVSGSPARLSAINKGKGRSEEQQQHQWQDSQVRIGKDFLAKRFMCQVGFTHLVPRISSI